MESSITKARGNAANYISPAVIEPTTENKSTAVAVAGNTLPTTPTDPTQLESYIKSAEGLKSAAEAMRDKPGITKEEFEYWDKVAKTCALAALDAALKLSEAINTITPTPGKRTDKEPLTEDGRSSEDIIKTKEQILRDKFGMNPQKASRIAQLTKLAVAAEKKRAVEEDDTVSIRRAYAFIEKQEKTRKGGRKSAAAFNSSRPTKAKAAVPPTGKFNVIYTDLESARTTERLGERIVDTAIMFLLYDPAEQVSAMKCIGYFGFEYQDCAVAMVDKVANQSGYLQSNHRHLLVATKGEFPKPEFWHLPSFGDGIALGGKDAVEHFREAIKTMYPDGAMLDLTPVATDCESDETESEGESHE